MIPGPAEEVDGPLDPVGLPAARTLFPDGPAAWGVAGLRGFFLGDQVAPNGLEYRPIFSLDLNLNLWLWRAQRLYLFGDTRFWGQKAAPGITNPTQGPFDFSKRELDLSVGLAWNYWGPLEGRLFAYSANNLNRGQYTDRPSGFNDGVGVENRWYVRGTYADLGQAGFDVTRATFLSFGFYPTKDMVDGNGCLFKPGPFLRAYLTYDLVGQRWYLFGDVQGLATRSFAPKQIFLDAGTAVRPFLKLPRLELRLGIEDRYDLQDHEQEFDIYAALRFIF